MTASRWNRLAELLESALAVPDAHRAAFVERATGDDPELRAELDDLIDASDGAEEYVGGLQAELLGTSMPGLVREASRWVDVPDPWIGRTVSHYCILGPMGGGGMGVIYRARDLRLDRVVALKFIAPEIRVDPKMRTRFLDEARATSALDHPNICTIHDIGQTDDGRMFMVMAAYDGETLRDRLRRGPLSEPEALDVCEQIASALAAAHERGIVHGDVKPDNVFLTTGGVVKLLDFGLARSTAGRTTEAGGGTAAYMSPEQEDGRPATERSDVWALGVTLFEMLAGARPFGGRDTHREVDGVRNAVADLSAARPDLSLAVTELVHRALSRWPSSRPADGGELVAELRRCGSTWSFSRPAASRVGHRSRMGRVAVALLGVLVLISSDGGVAPGTASAARPSVSHVLWVDDNPEDNADLIRLLAERGVGVTTASSTAEALERYDPAVHELVISDMARYEGASGYDGRAGLELLGALRARNADVRLVFYTSSRAAGLNRAEADSAGALGVVAESDALLRLLGLGDGEPTSSTGPGRGASGA